MNRISFVLSAVVLTLFAADANAKDRDRDRDRDRCRAEISATGTASLTQGGAEKSAEANWRRTVIARHGEFYSDFGKALDSSKQCGKTMLKLTRCEVRARPCPSELSAPSGQASCAGKSDRCDEGVLEIQLLLGKKGCPLEKEDGIEGNDTRKAIRCFQEKSKLKRTGEIDEATRDALGLK